MIMQQLGKMKKVVTLFAVSSMATREAIEIYASSRPEFKVAAAVTSGWDLLELLRHGMRPAVIALDVPMPDVPIGTLLDEIQHFSPETEILLLAQTEDEKEFSQILLTYRKCSVILKPYTLAQMFSLVYCHGASLQDGHLYQTGSRCSQVLDTLRASSRLNGRSYLQTMVVYNTLKANDTSLLEMKRYIADQYDSNEVAVTAALNRLNDEIHKCGSQMYRRFCVQNGLAATAKLSVGTLVKCVCNEVRYYRV